MTVSNQTAKTSATGTGAVGQQIPFSFPIVDTSDIICTVRVTATGVETDLTETTDYTVTKNGDAGGTVTTVTAVETSEEIYVYRRVPRTQTLDLSQGGSFNAENIEDVLDRLVMQINDLQEQIDRCIKIPVTETNTVEIDNSVDRASDYFKFDSNGDISMESS